MPGLERSNTHTHTHTHTESGQEKKLIMKPRSERGHDGRRQARNRTNRVLLRGRSCGKRDDKGMCVCVCVCVVGSKMDDGPLVHSVSSFSFPSSLLCF